MEPLSFIVLVSSPTLPQMVSPNGSHYCRVEATHPVEVDLWENSTELDMCIRTYNMLRQELGDTYEITLSIPLVYSPLTGNLEIMGEVGTTLLKDRGSGR